MSPGLLSRLFGGRRERATATPVDLDALVDLWALLAPMEGRITPESLAAMRARGVAFDDARLVRADQQLSLAMSVMDTEEHARHLGQDAWTGMGEPFGRRRFVRALHTAVVAGPVAVARVRDRPEALVEYDTAPVPPVRVDDGSLSRHIEALLIDRDGPDGELSRGASVLQDFDTHSEKRIAWPSVYAWEVAENWDHDFATLDPEGAWLDLWADLTDRDTVPVDAPGLGLAERYPWFEPTGDAAARIMAELDLRLPRRIGTVPLDGVRVRLVRSGTAEADELAATDAGTASEPSFGSLPVVAVVPGHEADAVPVTGRTDALVRWASTALAAHPVVHPETRAVLERLAR